VSQGTLVTGLHLIVADSVTQAPFEGLPAGTEQVASDVGVVPPHSVLQEVVKQASSLSTASLLFASQLDPSIEQLRQPSVSLQVKSSRQQFAWRHVSQSLGLRMPEQSTGSPPPVPVAPDVVAEPVVVPVVVVAEPVVVPVVVVAEPVVVPVGVPVVVLGLSPPDPPEPEDVEEVVVVPSPQAKGTRGAIAAATRIQEYFFICCSLEE